MFGGGGGVAQFQEDLSDSKVKYGQIHFFRLDETRRHHSAALLNLSVSAGFLDQRPCAINVACHIGILLNPAPRCGSIGGLESRACCKHARLSLLRTLWSLDSRYGWLPHLKCALQTAKFLLRNQVKSSCQTWHETTATTCWLAEFQRQIST